MDNIPAHYVAAIAPLIQSVGANVLYQSPYSPDFNPIEDWWSQQSRFFTPVLSNHNKNG
jgi:transposase